MKKLGVLVSLVGFSFCASAQSVNLDDRGVNKFSADPIPESHIMYKKSLWRMMDLREKQNQPFFASGMEVTQVIIDAVKKGLIQPWKTDSLSDGTPLTTEEFMEKLVIPSAEEAYSDDELEFLGGDGGGDGGGGGGDDPFGFGGGGDDPFGFGGGGDDPFGFGGGGDDPFGGGGAAEEKKPAEKKAGEVFYYAGKDLWQLELKEDIIFDKQRSRMVKDILAFTLLIPADHPDNLKGIEETVASFSYKELVEKVFTNNPKAIWFNPYNDKEHKSIADAFKLRLFSSYLTRMSDPQNRTITDIYGGDPGAGIQAARYEENKLLEFEHNLWSY
ncbi:MAG: gliding motility protein GldN [Cyclobacteriaceae bacterium]